MRRLRHTAVLLVALAGLVTASPAAASPGAVIKDCAHDGVLDKKYSNKDLKRARERLPSDLDEYSDCREVIGAAIGGGGRGGGGDRAAGGKGGPNRGAAGGTREDHKALERATSGKVPPSVKIGDKRVEPGSSGLFDVSSASQDIPVPLAVALIGVALLALGGSLYVLRRRIPALARLSLKPRLPSLRRVPPSRLRR